ncbi:ankyrin repeat domain-containing protein [Luteimonas gilva]|uniref:Ankyrin repeat domain-containing protein n=1 Tax=Luteimonas gilva TaxID=2572684 RepID=A0A4U5JTS8_9GAMM|nr:ankyrin repeat domain-containing protein [Luteimonas gilva]TKR33232.1 ankyrin repeat domain-containing protein [Luteimonas gilva]
MTIADPIPDHAPLALAAFGAIQAGDAAALRRLLADNPGLATARIVSDGTNCGRGERSLLHIATDWPGHFPRVAETIAELVRAGADVDARFAGAHAETALHWAASCDDVAALDALLDAGADIEAPGAVIGGGTPLADARAFRQWKAAARLVERGAKTNIVDEATMGLLDRIRARFETSPPPEAEDISCAFWGACHGDRRECAEYLLDRGAELNWIASWEPMTPLDAALRSDAGDLADWLRGRGARSSRELG